MTIQQGTLAYIASETKKYEPLKAAHRFKNVEDKVAFLWGDPVYVISTNRSSTPGMSLT